MGRRLLLASPHMSDEGFELEYIHDAFNKNWIAPLGENVNALKPIWRNISVQSIQLRCRRVRRQYIWQ